MICFPNTKINIGLNIVEKRADGYHNIESIFYPVPIYDILEINRATTFQFTSSGLPIHGSDDENLVVKAYRLLANQFHIDPVHIHLHKQIPMGAGLGGGSADAAFTLTTLNTLFQLGLSQNKLAQLALTLGSDCPFFIFNQPQFVSGRGENLTPIDLNLKGYFLYLVNNGTHIGTETAYARITPTPSDIDLKTLDPEHIHLWHQKVKNDFESGVFEQYPSLKKIKSQLYKKGAEYVAMTGSGSSIFGLFKTQPSLGGLADYETIVSL